MNRSRNEVVNQVQSWLGKNERDGSHKEIIDIYNAHKPLARGYKVKYSDAWCATTISAVAIVLGYTDIIPTECGCGQMINLFKEMECWVENDAYVPQPGDVIFYDWQDTGKGDNTGWPDHVGVVEKVSGSTITVIEGNLSNAVKRRTIAVNGKTIRGYGIPKYDAEVQPAPAPVPQPSKFNQDVYEWQLAAIADGFQFPKYGADGEWGPECEAVAEQAVVKLRVYYDKNGKKRYSYVYPNLTKFVQKKVGTTVDGKFGVKSDAATKVYQGKRGLVQDGDAGIKTYKVMCGV